MKRLLATSLTILFLTPISQAQNDACKLRLTEAPEVRGFKLGMSKEQVKVRTSERLLGIDTPNEIGEAKASLYASLLINKEDATGVGYIELEFLDDRLTHITVHYDRSVRWNNVEEFAKAVSAKLGLPGMIMLGGEQYKDIARGLICDGFSIGVILIEEAQGKLLLGETNLKPIKEKRRAEIKKREQQTFKP